MIVRSRDTPVLNQMREDILEEHPQIKIADVPSFYDTSIFNECERMNYLMETLDIWADVHPSLVTLSMEWEYEIPYGIIYSKSPSKAVVRFIDFVSEILVTQASFSSCCDDFSVLHLRLRPQ